MPFTALFQSAALGPDITRAMGDAFQQALKTLHDTGQPQFVQEVIARRIIDVAKRGVTDPTELCSETLKSLGFSVECD